MGERLVVVDVVNLQSAVPIDEERVRSVVAFVLEREGVAEGEVSVALVTDEEMARLNATYRGVDGTTDVLSFPLDESPLAGEIVVSPAEVARAARDRGGFDAELTTVLVHGVLHLLGYDHEESEAEADAMWARQEELVAALST